MGTVRPFPRLNTSLPRFLLTLIISSSFISSSTSFLRPSHSPRAAPICVSSSSSSESDDSRAPPVLLPRREMMVGTALAAMLSPRAALSDEGKVPTDLPGLLQILKESQAMLDEVPELLKAEKWDAVRALLIKPPLSDLWEKRAGRPVLKNLATAIGDADGDELAALEAREDVISHLRFLDMAVYNNVFNPIGSEGTTGATKELVRSYYEDPKNELALVQKALLEVQELAKGVAK